MKYVIMIAILLLMTDAILFAQDDWTKHIIDDAFGGARSVYALDLDSDDDVDVLGAAYDDDDIVWWENDGSQPPAFLKHPIDTLFDVAVSVYAADLDGDLDIDVLGTAYFAGDVVWWENDGNENFTEHLIDSNFNGANSVYAVDLDGDDDVDVLGTAYFADDIAWWENDGSQPPSFLKHPIDTLFDGARSVYAANLDSDDDMDVLGAAFDTDDIVWWENDGSENFVRHPIDTLFDGAVSMYAANLDGDDDIDVLGAAGQMLMLLFGGRMTVTGILSNIRLIHSSIMPFLCMLLI